MKQLVGIKVVQFFLYEKLDLRASPTTGIFGPNGSGKSALLDGIQIAMFGGNTRLASFNAQADENLSNTRSVRSYCLGQYGDSEADRVRDQATTYITLIWRDTVTQIPVSMGVCISAGIGSDGHEVLGRYLLPGIELSMGDHLELLDGRERPREWAAFRHQLGERAKVSGDEPLFKESERYIRSMLFALRGSGGMPQYDSFTRAFRFALRMRFDKSVDEIVRYQVLESRPTNIKKFKEVTESFKRLAAMVADVERRIDEGDAVEKDFAKADEEFRRGVTWKALDHVVQQQQATEACDRAQQELFEAEAALTAATEKLTTTENSWRFASDEALRFKLLRESHAAHATSGALQSQIEQERRSASSKERELAESIGALRSVIREAAASDLVQDARPQLLACVAALDELIQAPPVDREALRRSLRPALKAVGLALKGLFQARRQIENEADTIETEIKGATDDLQRIKQGRAPLEPVVRHLLNALHDKGLSPTPVCDLVRITDPTWQPVIEGYLGINAQALLVSDSEEGEAFRVYRGLSASVVGAKLARESRHENRRSPAPGSVAELIEGTHKAAVNYLRSKFGDAKRAMTDAESLASSHSLTVDGMFVVDGEIDRKPLARTFRIGGGSPAQLEEMNEHLVRLRAKAAAANLRKVTAETLWQRLQLFGGEAGVLDRTLASFDAQKAAEDTVESLKQLLTDSANEEYVKLGEQERSWTIEAEAASSAYKADAQLQGAASQRQKNSLAAQALADAKMIDAAAAVSLAKANDAYDRDFSARTWDALLEQYESDYPGMRQHCELQGKACGRRSEQASSSGTGKLGQFLSTHREHASAEVLADWRKSRRWMLELLQRLKDTTLAEYKAEMDEAYRTSQATFRNDVALALNENLKWLELTQDRLNDVLRTCPVFSNGERYRFKRTTRPAFEPLFRFIKNLADHGIAEDLFGGAGEMPEQFRQLLEDKLAPGAAGTKSPLDDYREFFEFDIEIYREDPATGKQKIVGHLSKRLGSGSGGEHRAPLYVIAGAALASAYRLDKGSLGGMRLILLDEAFNKMDMGNVIATMRYLEDLGLQVVMASPGENLGTLTAFLHRYFEISRDAERNVLRLEGHDVSEATRAMFREDLPEFNPELVAEEVRRMTPAEISGRAEVR